MIRRRTAAAALASSLILLVALVAGCSGSGSSSSSNTEVKPLLPDDGGKSDEELGYQRTGWDAGLEQQATEIANTIAASPTGCKDIAPHPFAAYLQSYKAIRLPMPGASVGCTTNDDQDIHVEVFGSPEAKLAFKDRKIVVICPHAREVANDTTGGRPTVLLQVLPYAEGENWIVEPDLAPTAEALGALLSGTSGEMCA